MTSNEEDVEFAKEKHIALRDPRWRWNGSYTFLDVWCWLISTPIVYTDVEGDFEAEVRIGFRNTGQSTRFFVRVSSLGYPSFSYIADLGVDAGSVSIEDLIMSGTVCGVSLLAKRLPEINAKKVAFLRTLNDTDEQ